MAVVNHINDLEKLGNYWTGWLPGPPLIANAIAEYKSSVRPSAWRECAAFVLEWMRHIALPRLLPRVLLSNIPEAAQDITPKIKK